MHVVFRESHGLEETDAPYDPGQDPADLLVLSFSDSDLGAFAAGWHRAGGKLPATRLQNIVALRHPLSVDTYLERTVSGAKGVLVRLIGGESYWPYGLAALSDLARKQGLALAILPADGQEDARLDALSTLPKSTLLRLKTLCDAGGAVAAQAALAQLALAAGLYAGPVAGAKDVPPMGLYDPARGVIAGLPDGPEPLALVVFYRAYLTAADTAPVDALIHALRARGFRACGAFAPSLKAPGVSDWLVPLLASAKPAALISATAFSARSDSGPSPLDAAGCPVFQVALSTARRRDWAASERGLSPADLAMHVVLPEVDGRIFLGAISFKSPGKRDPDLQFSRFAHRPDPARIEAACDRITSWVALRAPEKRAALVLSTYPGKGWNLAHAVGLDALASTETIARDLGAEAPNLAQRLTTERLSYPLTDYRAALATLPDSLKQTLFSAWGDPTDDPLFSAGAFHFPALRAGRHLIALQPERGEVSARDGDYHDLQRTPRHAYVAFYLWLRTQADALIHIGAHGTLEWLPGKSVALSDDCWPEALTGALPVIYPFIVNDPGEAAQARRRIGAVTLGHMPPPLTGSDVPPALQNLERLLDEYSNAEGLDPSRRSRLIADIRSEAQAAGVEQDLALDRAASPAEALTRIDRFVCDIKESQFGDGLHIWGTGPCGEAEKQGLLQAFSGLRVEAGPSGSPYRGRSDVMPTGRNLYATDPRAVPSRAAHAQGVKLAEELIRRHLQDHGDVPRGLVVDLWGSATMRTAGEDFAMAMHLAGAAPKWDEGSGRVSGFEMLPLALLGRPRIDVTLRVSGLFRDVFQTLTQMFSSLTDALATRDETAEDNPYRAAGPRVFGPKPGLYGLGMGDALETYSEDARDSAGEAWLAGSEWALPASGEATRDRAALEAQVQSAEAFVHVQDLAETDLLLASDYAAHEAGFAAAAATLGAAPTLYHVDGTRETPRARLLTEELARVVRARAANPRWADGMMRHGFRGGAEIAATLDHLGSFAHLTRDVPAHLFDLYHDATLGRPEVLAFLERENPAALAAMRARFAALQEAGLWVSRRNSLAMGVA